MSLEIQFFTTIELEERMLVEILIASLNQIRLCFQVGILGFIKLSDCSLAILVLGLHQLKGIL